MDSYLAGAPAGFHPCVERMNAAAASGSGTDLRRLSIQTLRGTSDRVGFGGLSVRNASTAATDSEEERQVSMGLAFIYRGAKQHSTTGEDLDVKLQLATDLSDAARGIICEAYMAQSSLRTASGEGASKSGNAEEGTAAAMHVLGLGQYAGMDWKVGVAASSSTAKNLRKPFVSLLLHITTETGRKSYPVEMSMKEFGDFARSVQEMSTALDNH